MRAARPAPLCLTGRGTMACFSFIEGFYNPGPAALGPRLSLAHLLRTGDANRPTARYPLNRPRKRGNFTVCRRRLPQDPAGRRHHPIYEPQAKLPGQCADESSFSTLKTELVHQREYPDRDAARRDLFASIEAYYNRRPIHAAIGYITQSRQTGKPNNLVSTVPGEGQSRARAGERTAARKRPTLADRSLRGADHSTSCSRATTRRSKKEAS